VSPRRGLAAAIHLATLTSGATVAYIVLIYELPGALSLFFGKEFMEYHAIFVPIGVGQVIAAPAFGLSLFLMAERRGASLLLVTSLGAGLQLAFAAGFGAAFGLEGAAWSYAASAAVANTALCVVLRRRIHALRAVDGT
jgi:O-antigen/teichoic acid export membrane protein